MSVANMLVYIVVNEPGHLTCGSWSRHLDMWLGARGSMVPGVSIRGGGGYNREQLDSFFRS